MNWKVEVIYLKAIAYDDFVPGFSRYVVDEVGELQQLMFLQSAGPAQNCVFIRGSIFIVHGCNLCVPEFLP